MDKRDSNGSKSVSLQERILREKRRTADEKLFRNIECVKRLERSSSPHDVLRKKYCISIRYGVSLDMFLKWDECKFSHTLLEKIPFRDMRPVQMQVIPYIYAEKSICVLSETGSGKTLSFILPYAQMLSDAFVLLVIAPTKELAGQIHTEFQKYLVKSALITGSVEFEKQRVRLQDAHVIVSTIGRLLDHMNFKTVDFEKIRYLVVDEMDKILGDGFENEFLEVWRRLSLKAVQLFSATESRSIGKFGVKTLITVGRINRINSKVKLRFLQPRNKLDSLDKILSEYREKGRTMMIFCNRIGTCELLESKFKSLTAIHGKKSSLHREMVMKKLYSGLVRYLVCTDVASRGIDVENVDLVLNYDFPRSIETFIHRAGRTGRNIEGTCVSFLTREDVPMYQSLRTLSSECGFDVPEFMKNSKGSGY